MSDDVKYASEPAQSLVAVIATNAKRLRRDAGLTLDQVSIAARQRGLNWSQSRIADLEAGRVAAAVNIDSLVPFCLALRDAGCQKASIGQLLYSTPSIQLNDSVVLYDKELVALLGGASIEDVLVRKRAEQERQPFTTMRPEEWNIAAAFPVEFVAAQKVHRSSGATEDRMRRSLGISSSLLETITASLWGCTFSQERDRRAGEGASAQKRGQVTRQMRAEIEKAVEDTKLGISE